MKISTTTYAGKRCHSVHFSSATGRLSLYFSYETLVAVSGYSDNPVQVRSDLNYSSTTTHHLTTMECRYDKRVSEDELQAAVADLMHDLVADECLTMLKAANKGEVQQ